MNGLVTTGSPAGALAHTRCMVRAADQQPPALDLLEVAFQAEVGVTHRQQLVVNRPVRIMAGEASFPHCLVLENERPPLGFVTPDARIILGKDRRAAAHVRAAFVGRMAFRAAHPALGNRMVMGQLKLPADVDVTLEAHVIHRTLRFGRNRLEAGGAWSSRRETERRLHFAAGFGMDAARAVAGFAPGLQGSWALGNQPGVISRGEIPVEFVVAGLAFP